MPELSVVIPVFNEDESLDALFKEMKASLDAWGRDYEIIFVNDGSTDGSVAKINGFKRRFNSLVHIVDLPQRSGQTFALKKGLEKARGKIVATLDADLQNDPADIPKLLTKMEEGYDVVCGWRKDRNDPWLKKKLSKMGNIFQRAISGLDVHDISCTLRVYRKECADSLPLDWEGQHRFIPLVLLRQGFKIGEVATRHRERRFGYSKYSHKRIFKVVGDFFKVLSIPRRKR